mmetsp:Transcript_1508/g.3810  ORF Transcript_1508/g.3810 Transcript_1508/m.3810 type:complete len:211 (+) Transcript_1508:454-1086(+)
MGCGLRRLRRGGSRSGHGRSRRQHGLPGRPRGDGRPCVEGMPGGISGNPRVHGLQGDGSGQAPVQGRRRIGPSEARSSGGDRPRTDPVDGRRRTLERRPGHADRWTDGRALEDDDAAVQGRSEEDRAREEGQGRPVRDGHGRADTAIGRRPEAPRRRDEGPGEVPRGGRPLSEERERGGDGRRASGRSKKRSFLLLATLGSRPGRDGTGR